MQGLYQTRNNEGVTEKLFVFLVIQRLTRYAHLIRIIFLVVFSFFQKKRKKSSLFKKRKLEGRCIKWAKKAQKKAKKARKSRNKKVVV